MVSFHCSNWSNRTESLNLDLDATKILGIKQAEHDGTGQMNKSNYGIGSLSWRSFRQKESGKHCDRNVVRVGDG